MLMPTEWRPVQRVLFDLQTAPDNGTPPSVTDSDDLPEDPEQMTARFCDAVGIPFLKRALSWMPGGDPSAHSWWDGGSFHANLENPRASGPSRENTSRSPAPVRVQQVHRRMKPHNDHLCQHSIHLNSR